jgi:outer membrane biosynthesis protein TonB
VLGSIIPDFKKPAEQKEKRIKISLKEMPKKDKVSGIIKEKVEPITMAKPMPKGSQLKKIVKKEPIVYEPKKQVVRTPKLNPVKEAKPEPIPQPKIEPLPPKETYIPLPKPKKEEKVKGPMAWMYEDKSAEEPKKKEKKTSNASSINQNIKELYGDEFGKLSSAQQEYILDNQEIMRRITQEVLNRVARVNLPRDLNVNKSNVIEFYLHPNGDMSDFKFLSKSGLYVLDDTTRETIEYSYSKYPRPKEKTLIRYNVFYNLAY